MTTKNKSWLRKDYEANFVKADIWAGFWLGLLFNVLAWTFGFPQASVLTLFSTTAQVAGGLLGLIIAAFAILASLLDKNRLAKLRSEKPMADMLAVYRSAMWWLGISTIIGFLGVILGHSAILMPLLTGALLFGIGNSIVRVAGCIWILSEVSDVAITLPIETDEAASEEQMLSDNSTNGMASIAASDGAILVREKRTLEYKPDSDY